jgi:hypothetical protein
LLHREPDYGDEDHPANADSEAVEQVHHFKSASSGLPSGSFSIVAVKLSLNQCDRLRFRTDDYLKSFR